MARLDQLDPRWVVENREDGQNVNDWHWSEKDVTNKAKHILKNWVTSSTILQEENITLRLLAIRGEIEGEAIALNRRGKRGVFFDFDMKIEWQGEYKDRYGYQSSDAHGLLSFNVDQHSIDELTFDLTTESLKTSTSEIISNAMKTKGLTALKDRIKSFYTDLRCKYDPTMAQEMSENAKKLASEQEVLLKKEDEAMLEAEKQFTQTLEPTHNDKLKEINSKTTEIDNQNQELRRRKQQLDDELEAAKESYKKETSSPKAFTTQVVETCVPPTDEKGTQIRNHTNDETLSEIMSVTQVPSADQVKSEPLKTTKPPSENIKTGIRTANEQSEADQKQKEKDDAFLAFLDS